jgi:hypothetical protein
MDIHSKSAWPLCDLSTFSAHAFVFDGVSIASMEGFLQSLKFDRVDEQKDVCGLAGYKAKTRGAFRNEHFQECQTLYWNGGTYDRHGSGYADLLDRAYQALCDQNSGFRNALLATYSAPLTHSIGSSDPKLTILTAREFCDRLTMLRTQCQESLSREPMVVSAETRASMDRIAQKFAALRKSVP